MCPHCGQNAPVVYRGVAAYCAACGRLRVPLTGSALHLAGQPSRVGGIVARVVAWLVLGVGLSTALGAAAAMALVFQSGLLALAIGAPIGILSLVVGLILLQGGKRLGQNGASAEKQARTQALFALAAHHGGAITALDAARALDLPLPAAEALLQTLAKEEYETVGVDIDPSGSLVYRFVVASTASGSNTNQQTAAGPRVRVDPEIARSPNRAEWERLEAEEAERTAQAARARAR